MNETQSVRIPIAVAISAALVRLLPLHFLHPLNWDEIEFFTATKWIGQGLVPFRDFWEHHLPLMWFVFAPITRLTDTPGVGAIIALRWAQIPVWIATFWLLDLWMRNAGIARFARWCAMALALCSSLFMIPAVEYRVDSFGCLLVVLGLVLAQRERWFFAGAAYCLAGMANLRLGPVLVVAVLYALFTKRLRAAPIVAGGFAALFACLLYFAATDSLDDLWQQGWVDNTAQEYATPIEGAFVHRVLVPFGVRIFRTDRMFELAAVDVGGIAIVLLGVVAFAHAFRRRGALLNVAILQLANVTFVGIMKYIYNYHFELIVILMIPLIAALLERIEARRALIALLGLAWAVNLFASVFRGKELDRAYQDLIMREAHARTRPGDKVLSGIPWAIRAQPAYRFWFLPELTRQLVLIGKAPRYTLQDPPALVICDFNLRVWFSHVQGELPSQLARQYIPVWRELWVPAMNGVVPAGRSVQWKVPRSGLYRVYASPRLARHPWFRQPLETISYNGPDASRLTVQLPQAGAGPMQLDRDPARLEAGQIITATNPTQENVALILLSTDDRVLFRQPPPGATLEAETTRVTHVPQLGVRLVP